MRFWTLSTTTAESRADCEAEDVLLAPRADAWLGSAATSQTFHPPQPVGAKRVTSAHSSRREPSPSNQQLGFSLPQRPGTLPPGQRGIQGPEAPLGLAAHEVQGGGGEY